jgi:hypothetical protein
MLSSTRHAIVENEWVTTILMASSSASEVNLLTPSEVKRCYAAFELDQMASVERRVPLLTMPSHSRRRQSPHTLPYRESLRSYLQALQQALVAFE